MIDLNNGDYETYQLIKEAAALHFLTEESNIDVFYEHGQFWVALTDDDNEDDTEDSDEMPLLGAFKCTYVRWGV